MYLPPAHRLAQINYPNRTGSFGFSFLVVLALLAERGHSTWTVLLGLLTLLVYPHLAYLHARLAVDSKRAELRNLAVDSALMGIWAAQLHFALWPVCGALVGVCLNNAVCGGVSRLLSGLIVVVGAALVWTLLWGSAFEPATGLIVTWLCFFGIIGYATSLGLGFRDQNRRLSSTRNGLRASEDQFRFIAEHAGDLVAVLTPGHHILYASSSHGKYFNPEKYSGGGNWLFLVLPEDRKDARRFLESLHTSSNSKSAQLRILPTKGSWRVVECLGNPVHGPRGELQMIVLVCRDLGRWLDATNTGAAKSDSADGAS